MSESSSHQGGGLQARLEQNGLHSGALDGATPKVKDEVLDLSEIPKSPSKGYREDEEQPHDGEDSSSGRPSTSGQPAGDRAVEMEEPIECIFCRYRLEEGVHPRVVSCRECGWAATEPVRMRRHVRARHSGVKPSFYCQYCEHRVVGLESHLAAGFNDDRPYQCGECDYRARTTTALNYHLRAKHSSERPYKCPHCDYAGVQSSSLKSHMLTRHNTGQKNIQCPACDFRANVPSVMKKHVERKHGDQQFLITSRRGRRPGSLNQTYHEIQEPSVEPPSKLFKPTVRQSNPIYDSVERPVVNPYESTERALGNFYKTAQRSVASFYEANFYNAVSDPYRAYPSNPYESPSAPSHIVPEPESPPVRPPNPPNDVAEYLQMPSFGLFEAIYESQGLCPSDDKLRGSPDHRQNSEVILVDD